MFGRCPLLIRNLGQVLFNVHELRELYCVRRLMIKVREKSSVQWHWKPFVVIALKWQVRPIVHTQHGSQLLDVDPEVELAVRAS